MRKIKLFSMPNGMRSLMFLGLLGLLASCGQGAGSKDSVMNATFEGEGDDLERVKQEMVMPPLAPVHDQVAKGGPKIVEVTLEIQEMKMEVAPGDSIWALTFNGSVPGPLIVVHQN